MQKGTKIFYIHILKKKPLYQKENLAKIKLTRKQTQKNAKVLRRTDCWGFLPGIRQGSNPEPLDQEASGIPTELSWAVTCGVV